MKRLLSLLALSLVVACGDSNNDVQVGDNNTNNPANAQNVDTNAMNVGTTDTGNNGSNATTADMGSPDAGEGSDMGGPDQGSDTGNSTDMGPPPNPLDGIGTVSLVMDGFEFTEGPRWFADDNVLRFTDIPASTIYEVDMAGDISVFRNPSAQANGLAAGPMGRLLAAEHQGRRISVTTANGPQPLVDQYMGMAFNSPNDLVVHSGGWLYFTDPPYGLGNRTREIQFNGLFRHNPSTDTTVAEWEGGVNTRPNGVVLSPDETVLYLADTAAGKVSTFDVGPDGALSNQQDWVDSPNPDGMAVDTDGNIYVAASRGVDVFAPDGTLWGTVEIPQAPANVAFGGPNAGQLFVTARTGLYRVSVVVPGIY